MATIIENTSEVQNTEKLSLKKWGTEVSQFNKLLSDHTEYFEKVNKYLLPVKKELSTGLKNNKQVAELNADLQTTKIDLLNVQLQKKDLEITELDKNIFQVQKEVDGVSDKFNQQKEVHEELKQSNFSKWKQISELRLKLESLTTQKNQTEQYLKSKREVIENIEVDVK